LMADTLSMVTECRGEEVVSLEYAVSLAES
jgi:hypothetical protein